MSDRATAMAEQAEAHFSDPSRAGKLFVPSLVPAFARNAIAPNNNIGFEYESVEEAFPDVDPGLLPAGNLVLVQLRQPKLKSAGGLELQEFDRKTNLDNEQVARVVAVGPLAFRNRTTMEPWPEGAWCAVGDFVRVPKYQGDYFQIAYERDDWEVNDRTGARRTFRVRDRLLFAQYKDLALLGKYPDAATALSVKTFV